MNGRTNTLPEKHTLSPCDIISVIGEGGFGIVYQAWDRQLERYIAVKEYMPSSLAVRGDNFRVIVRSNNAKETFEAGRKSFLNEARMLARFDHPSVVKVYQFWEENETAYIAMPLYGGQTLKDYLRSRSTPPSEQWVRELLVPLLSALELIHANQCYHRDIAPDNIILLEDGSPVLIDFGAARRVIGDMTQALTAVLKPGFAPIEQYADTNAVQQGAWTDIYALSAVLHYALTGKAPPTAVARIMSDSYEPLVNRLKGKYSAQLLHALDAGLVLSPGARPQSAREFRDLLFGDEQKSDRPTEIQAESREPEGLSDPLVPVSVFPIRQDTLNLARTQPTKTNWMAKRFSFWLVGALILGVTILFGLIFSRNSPPSKPPSEPPQVQTKVSTQTPAQSTEASAVAQTVPTEPVDFFAFLISKSTNDAGLEATTTQPKYVIEKEKVLFKVRVTKPSYVYIFLKSADGTVNLVFPNSSEQNNEIRGAAWATLPRNNNFTAAGPPGKSSALVMVSATRRQFETLLVAKAGELPSVNSEKFATMLQTEEASKAVGATRCASSDLLCSSFSTAVIEFDTHP